MRRRRAEWVANLARLVDGPSSECMSQSHAPAGHVQLPQMMLLPHLVTNLAMGCETPCDCFAPLSNEYFGFCVSFGFDASFGFDGSFGFNSSL